MAKSANKVTADQAEKIAAKAASGEAHTVYANETDAMTDILSKAADGLPEPSDTIKPEGSIFAPVEPANPEPQTNEANNPFSGGPNIPAGFDPSLHEVDPNGSPVFNADGSYRRKRGRKTGVVYSNSGADSSSLYGPTDQAELAKRKAAAKTAVQILVMGGVSVFGTEWQPIRDKQAGVDERAMLEGAFENYFEAAGTIDLPPGIALALAVGAYALPRFQLPNTQERAAKIGGGVRGWFANWKAKRSAAKHAGNMQIAA